MTHFRLIGCWLFAQIFALSVAHAQIVGASAFQHKNFKYHNKPPKYLNSHRSVVLISVPRNKKDMRIREDWKSLARTVHPQFKRMKIDAIAYYYLDDVLGSSDVSTAFASQMTKREIKYIILLEQSRTVDTGQEDHFKITVVPFNKFRTFVSQNANAWKVEGVGLANTMEEAFKEVYRAELEQKNYLIPDQPEIFTDVDIFTSRRIPTYAMDLKVEPLIIPRFEKIVIKDRSKMDQATIDRIDAYNLTIDQKNQRLEEIMKTYPLKYEIVDEYTDKEIYNKGGQFVLLMMQAEGRTVKQWLDFETPATENVYASIKSTEVGSTVLRLPSDAVVSKYIVKHVFTRDIYTGLNWDADLTWETALQNFIYNMKDVLKIN